jgi:hypothetical protein
MLQIVGHMLQILGQMLQIVGQTHKINRLLIQGILTEGEGCTVDLIIKLHCFVKR